MSIQTLENTEPVWHDYDYAIISLVPRVQLGIEVYVGVILHARTANFIGVRINMDPSRWKDCCPSSLSDASVRSHLAAYEAIAAGTPESGPIGLLPPSERFHWLTATRSAAIQTSALRTGRTTDPEKTLETLFAATVL